MISVPDLTRLHRISASAELASESSIADYGVIGDCGTAALVSNSGSIDWLCLPHFSGSSLFAALLDGAKGGRFAIRPSAPFSVARRYRGASNVLETTFTTASGRLRLVDCMSIPPATGQNGAQIRPLREILRTVEVLDGVVEVEIVFEPRPDYGRREPAMQARGALGWSCQHRGDWFLLRSEVSLKPAPDSTSLKGCIELQVGDMRSLSLAYTRNEPGAVPLLGASAIQRHADTQRWWEEWSGRCSYDGPYREAVQRSALVLKLLTYAPSGAVVAAATTSLPEAVGGSKNWDYRFCWLRDAALTLSAFVELGYREEADAFLGWLLHATRLTWPELQVLYDVYGEAEVPEQELDHLSGYRGSRPVRIGNAAHAQRQLDVYGSVVQAAYDFVQSGGRLQAAEATLLSRFGETVCRLWREPDAGIWELRGPPRHYTHSKLMCWAALDRLIDLHQRGHVRVPEERFRRERGAIRETIERHGFDAKLESYVGVFDTAEPDAALLLISRCGFHDASDPRLVGTYRHLKQELGRGALFHRFRGPNGSMPDEGAFGACGFWAVADRARRGEVEAAQQDFEALLGFANDVGLFAEETDPDTGSALGNMPQAFTHIGLIDAALALQRAREQPRGRG